jgi:hypothetical protein
VEVVFQSVVNQAHTTAFGCIQLLDEFGLLPLSPNKVHAMAIFGVLLIWIHEEVGSAFVPPAAALYYLTHRPVVVAHSDEESEERRVHFRLLVLVFDIQNLV